MKNPGNDSIGKKAADEYALISIGMEQEKAGNIAAAVMLYEKAVAMQSAASHPYDRLATIYRKEKRYDDEIRICRAFLKVNEGVNNQPKIERFQARLQKAQDLKRKSARG